MCNACNCIFIVQDQDMGNFSQTKKRNRLAAIIKNREIYGNKKQQQFVIQRDCYFLCFLRNSLKFTAPLNKIMTLLEL